ncbi:MAG: S8 family peptidase [Gammaproteobacteria bacterium]
MRAATRSLLLVLAVTLIAIAPSAAFAVVRDLSLEPPQNRSVEVGSHEDLELLKKAFFDSYPAEDNGAQNYEERENSDGSFTFNFPMPDKDWDQQKGDLCNLPGVVSCGVNHCREFLAADEGFSGKVTSIQGGPVAGAKVSLMPTPPSVSEFVQEEEDEDEDNALNLNLRPGKRRCESQPSGMGPIVGDASGSGQFSLDLPSNFDPGCWELKAAEACEVQDLPTRSVMPESEPMHLLALLPGASTQASQDQKDAANAAGTAAGMTVVELVPLVSIDKTLVRFRVNSGGIAGTDLAMQALQALPLFEGTQKEQRFRTAAATAGDDPFAWMNYGAEQIGAQQLQSVADGSGVTVAVIDTGVDGTHPELSSRMVDNVDVSGFGMSADRHGTAIAGIIAAESGNGIGSYGVAPGTQILGIKACEPESTTAVASRCWSSTLAKALDRALQSDAAIINMSLGGPEDMLIGMLLDKAADNGVLVLAAAGNDGPAAPPPFPASHPAVMAITAVDSAERVYADAVRGEFIDVAAPGVEIPVPVPGEIYPAQLSGTSMATAHVAGAAALLKSMQPGASAAELRTSLETSAVGDARNALVGHGRIDVCGAAKAVSAGQTGCAD